MEYVLLLVIIFFSAFVWYLIFDRDIISPTIISYISYFICILLAFIGLGNWNFNYNLNYKLILIIVIGLFSFGVGELLYRIFHTHYYKKENDLFYNKIEIKKWKNFICIIFMIITIVLSYIEIKRACAKFGFYSNNISNLLVYYRYKTSLFSTELIDVGIITSIVNQMKKAAYLIGIIYIYIFTNNIINKLPFKKNIPSFLIICLSLVLGFLSSGRFEMLKYIIALITSYCIITLNKKKKINLKIFKTIIIAALIIIPVFYNILHFLGRDTKSNLMNYTSFYFGTSIPSFNEYLSVDHKPSEVFGEESLYGIQSILYKMKITNNINVISREWTVFYDKQTGGRLLSNVYTSFRRYYHDFGILGVVICQFIFGYVFSMLYYKARYSGKIFNYIFYLSFIYMLIDQVRDDLFITRFFHINTIIYIILIKLLLIFLLPKRKSDLYAN